MLVSFTCFLSLNSAHNIKYFLCALNSIDCCPTDRLYVQSYPRTSNRTHSFPREQIFFRDIHYRTVQLQDAVWLYILFMMKLIFFDFSFMICRSFRKCTVHPGQILLPPLWKKPCPPTGCLQGLYYISHTTRPNLNYVYDSSTVVSRFFQNQYLIGLVRINEIEVTVASA